MSLWSGIRDAWRIMRGEYPVRPAADVSDPHIDWLRERENAAQLEIVRSRPEHEERLNKLEHLLLASQQERRKKVSRR